MQKQTAAAAAIIEIPIGQIVVKRNARSSIDKEDLKGLTSSILQDGVIEPLLVRPNGGKGKFELIAGARRLAAATIAKLKAVPAIVKDVDDETAYRLQLIENLQRVDLPEMDQAFAYRGLLETKLSVAEIARQVGKDEKYIRQRLELTRLNPAAQKAFRKGEIVFGHAFQIARLDDSLQTRALEQAQRNITVLDLQRWIAQNMQQALAQATWKLDDAAVLAPAKTPRLTLTPPAAPACSTCPMNTGNDKLLFSDFTGHNVCMLPACFSLKQQATVARVIVEQTVDKKPPLAISLAYSVHNEKVPANTLTNDHYRIVSKDHPCKSAQPAVVVHKNSHSGDTQKVGQVVEVCTSKDCKVHFSSNGHRSTRTERKSPEGFAKRKQEIWEQKVYEETRQQVIKEAATKVKKLGRVELIQIATKLYSELDNKGLVLKLMGWEDPEVKQGNTYGRDGRQLDAVKARLTGSDVAATRGPSDIGDRELNQFIYLCGVVDIGLATWNKTDKDALTNLAKQHNVNLKLHDAESRVALGLKKHASTHAAYLTQVQQNKKVTAPQVYIDSQKAQADPKQGKLKAATSKKPAKKAAKVANKPLRKPARSRAGK